MVFVSALVAGLGGGIGREAAGRGMDNAFGHRTQYVQHSYGEPAPQNEGFFQRAMADPTPPAHRNPPNPRPVVAQQNKPIGT
jgi:hypothetical protein